MVLAEGGEKSRVTGWKRWGKKDVFGASGGLGWGV